MTEGPPPSESGPSKPSVPLASSSAVPTSIPNHVVQTFPQGVAQAAPTNQPYPYYGYSASWTNAAWSGNAYQYGSQFHQPYPQANAYQTQQFTHYPPQVQHQVSAALQSPNERNLSVSQPASATGLQPKARTPSPTPPRELPSYWDSAIKTFLSSAGLTQALKGFEADMLVLNPEWERDEVPAALEELATDLKHLLEKGNSADPRPMRSLEERKLDYVHLEKDAEPRSQTSINKSISLFLARNRARNDASNRNEFLHAQKRRRFGPAESSTSPLADDEHTPSCARTDAKTVDRDVMMKFDIARNDEGPLRRTMKTEEQEAKLRTADDKTKARTVGENGLTVERHPGVDERLQNIETHTAMRYVPSPPVSLLDRIKFIEDHIIQLEREYPPWAALHFNQPRRGWPPPPRPTPVIVPSHLTSSAVSTTAHVSGSVETADGLSPSPTAGEAVNGTTKTPADVKGKGRTAKSSLHRAVMERLEVQRAMSDLRGESNQS